MDCAAILWNARADVAIVARSSADASMPSVVGFSTNESAMDLAFMPCSASNGLMPVVFHAAAMSGRYRWKFSYCCLVIMRKQLPTYAQTLSITELALGLCPFVVVRAQPMIEHSDSIALERNSPAASECISLGQALLTTISEGIVCCINSCSDFMCL